MKHHQLHSRVARGQPVHKSAFHPMSRTFHQESLEASDPRRIGQAPAPTKFSESPDLDSSPPLPSPPLASWMDLSSNSEISEYLEYLGHWCHCRYGSGWGFGRHLGSGSGKSQCLMPATPMWPRSPASPKSPSLPKRPHSEALDMLLVPLVPVMPVLFPSIMGDIPVLCPLALPSPRDVMVCNRKVRSCCHVCIGKPAWATN